MSDNVTKKKVGKMINLKLKIKLMWRETIFFIKAVFVVLMFAFSAGVAFTAGVNHAVGHFGADRFVISYTIHSEEIKKGDE